jgi:4-oxalocrotonate tautomerase family enzyme
MPHIVVHCPRLTRDKKARCVAALTKAFAESTGHSPEILTVHIQEYSYDNIGVAGQLLTETYPELNAREEPYRLREKPANTG